jgi:hypothetical protein
MSINIMNKIWTQSVAAGPELLLLLAIGDRCDDEGICWPGLNKLAEKTKTSTRTIMRCLQKIEATGELFIMRGQGHQVNWYFVVLGLSADQIITMLISRLKLSPVEAAEVTRRLRPTEPVEAPPPKNGHRNGDKMSPKPPKYRDNLSPLETSNGDIPGTNGDKSTETVTNPFGIGDTAMSPDSSMDSSINPSEDSSVREEAAPNPEPTWNELTIKEIGLVPEIALFRQVTGRFPGRPQYSLIWSTFREHPDWNFKYLQPFWLEWAAVRAYNQSALGWLLEWAKAGVIPPRGPKTNGNGRFATPLEKSLQALKEFGEENGD